jgi:hypothetical protein
LCGRFRFFTGVPALAVVKTANVHSGFWKSLGIALVAASISKGFLLAKPPQTGLGITVQVYNWASVATQTLAAAETQATRIFHDAGVAVSWLNCPLTSSEHQANPICIEPGSSNHFVVRINPQAPADRTTTSLGVALSEGGIYATIFYPRVDEYAKERIATHDQILGHALAHELGHLLLGPVSHTRFGIMRGQWTREDLQSMAMGALLFSPQQSVAIQQAAMRRMGGPRNSAK